MRADLRIGYAAAELPVPNGTPLGGYLPLRSSTGTHDPLELAVLLLDDGDHRFGLVLIDLVCVNSDLVGAVRAALRTETAVPLDVWVGASHTHSGPDVGSRPGGGSTPRPWLEAIPRLAGECLRRAAAQLTTTTIRHAQAPLDGIASVRADAGAEHRVQADLIHWPGGAGLLAVIPVHSTVLPQSSTEVSADLHGAVRRRLRESFDGWVAVAPGCAGNISTRWTRRGQDHAECDRLGRSAAEQLLAALPTTSQVADQHSAIGPVVSTHLDLPIRIDDPEQLAQWSATSTAGSGSGGAQARVEATRQQGVEFARARVNDPAGSVDLRLGSARIGDLLLAAVGAEPYLGLRDRVRSAIGPAAVTLGYTGGYIGYLPDAAAHHDPSYEVLASPLRPEAEDLVVAALTELAERP